MGPDTTSSPRALRFSGDDEHRHEKLKPHRSSLAMLDRSDHGDYIMSPRSLESHDEVPGLQRYSDQSTLSPSISMLTPSSLSNGSTRNVRNNSGDLDNMYINGNSRPARPLGPARTPSSTYAPVRRPAQTSISSSFAETARSTSKSRRGERQFGPRAYKNAPYGPSYFDGYPPTSNGGYGDSDSEGETPSSEGHFEDRYDAETIMFYGNEELHPTEEDIKDPTNRERLEWHSMLEAVLTGDVVKQEKKRIIGATELSANYMNEMWMDLRAKVCGRHITVHKRVTEEARSSVDRTLDDMVNFQIQGETEAGKPPVDQVKDLIHRLEKAEAAYPSWSALAARHKTAKSEEFLEAYSVIMAWHNTNETINTQLSILKKWVGNEEMDFSRTKQRSPAGTGLNEETSFLDRLMKEDALKSMYNEEANEIVITDPSNGINDSIDLTQPSNTQTKIGAHPLVQRGLLYGLSLIIGRCKETCMTHSLAWEKRHLPQFIEELLTLLSFPSRLIEDIMKVRLAYAKKVKDRAQQNPLMLDQMITQFQGLLKLAIRIKLEYISVSQPEDGWDLPPCIDETFDMVILDALKYYFKMLNWKLISNKNSFKEAELLFQEWDFGNYIGSQLTGGDIEVAEQFSTLTFKALNRLNQAFEKELEVKPKETVSEMTKRYKQVLESFRTRQRMLQRFSRMLGDNYENASDFSISFPAEKLQELFDQLASSGHFRVLSETLDSTFIMLASPGLQCQPEAFRGFLSLTSFDQFASDDPNSNAYVLILRPEARPAWYGETVTVTLQEQAIELKRGHVRLCAAGAQSRLQNARKTFLDSIEMSLDLVVEQRSNIHKVNTRMMEAKRVAYRLSNNFMDSVETIRRQTMGGDCQELIQMCFVAATEFGQRSLLYMDSNRRQMNNIKLTKLALDWVNFICNDCDAADRRTFRWAVLALEFAMLMTRGRHILALDEAEYAELRAKVAGCMALLISHFDIMGARSTLAAQAENELSVQAFANQIKRLDQTRLLDDDQAAMYTMSQRMGELEKVDELRRQKEREVLATGQVLEVNNEVNRSLAYLSSAATNVTMRWQQGHFVGGGTFGQVYAAMNLDSGQLMAVKEIRLQDPKTIPAIAGQIKEEMEVLEVLDHPNVVSYYGIEVHRDRVYIFMEFCSGGSLAQLLEHGRIEDEKVSMVYALQMVEGIAYLHTWGIAHRDIKPENLLLDHNGLIKLVDFGAAKVIARHGRTMAAELSSKANKSMTGTPMYMSPEIIKGEHQEMARQADMWALGCVVLEMATGRRPWANLDNEWAIMYNIALGNLPQLPSEDQLSPKGIEFIQRCLIADPTKRATSAELFDHPWMWEIRRELLGDLLDDQPRPTPGFSTVQTAAAAAGFDGFN